MLPLNFILSLATILQTDRPEQALNLGLGKFALWMFGLRFGKIWLGNRWFSKKNIRLGCLKNVRTLQF